MAGFSYFLPPSVRRKVTSEDGVDNKDVNTLETVFSSMLNLGSSRVQQMIVTYFGRIHFLDDENIRVVCYSDKGLNTCKYKLSHYGVSLNSRAVDFSNNGRNTHKYKLSYYDVSLNLQGDIISVVKKSKNMINILYKRINAVGNPLVVKDFNLDYQYSINDCKAYMSAGAKMCVITTTYSSDINIYLDILSYETSDRSTEIRHDRRVKLPQNIAHLNTCTFTTATTLHFNPCGNKLFLVIGYSRKIYFVTYFITENLFGSVYELDKSDREHLNFDVFYAHHEVVGNIFLICGPDGVVSALREKKLNFSPLAGGELDLKEFGIPRGDSFYFMCINDFECIRMFVSVGNALYIFNYLQRSVVGKFIVPHNRYVLDVQTNWCGEEIFLLTEEDWIDNLKLDVLVANNRKKIPSLKRIAKLAVFQYYSLQQLKETKLPKMLRREMKLIDQE